MNRKTEEQTHHDILQSKYTLKERQRTLGVISGKSQLITLSDLCPQDKLKIGELIKINENRKQQIDELNEKQVSLQSALADCHSQLSQIQQQYQAKEDQLQQLISEFSKLKLANSQMQQQLSDLINENDSMKQELNKKKGIILKGTGVQTEETTTINYATQTKKIKQKAQAVQTQDFYENQSSGFEERSQSNSIDKYSKGRSAKFSRSRSNHTSKDSFAKSRRSKHQIKSKPDHEEIAQDDVEQCFQQLTRKWLHLKEKNLSKLKASYQDSKYRFGRDADIAPEPSPFLQQEQVIVTQSTDPHDLDQSELNTLLKSKDFSASRLLTAKRMILDNPKQRKRSYYVQSLKTDQTYQQKSKREPLVHRQHKLNIESQKQKKVLKPATDQGEGDLMDLVDSLW